VRIAYTGEIGNSYRILVAKPEMKRPFKGLRRRRRREYIIKTDQIGCGGVDRIQLAVVNVVMNVRVI
jgi:hypothetical protein